MSESDTERDWHPVEDAMYDVNELWEQVESEAAKAHVEDAVLSLKSALKAEQASDRPGDDTDHDQLGCWLVRYEDKHGNTIVRYLDSYPTGQESNPLAKISIVGWSA